MESDVPDRTPIDELLARYRSVIDRVGPDSARREAEAGAVIVDTRDTADRAAEGIIPGSVHLPLSVLLWRADPASAWSDERIADTDRRLIIVCNDGYSSSWAAATLKELGFGDVADLDGGYRAWARAGLPIDGVD